MFGPTQLSPSGTLLCEVLKYQHVRAFYVPPFVIEQWWAEPLASQQTKQLDFVPYGGGPLSPHIGNTLSKFTDVCQMYGSLEVGQVQLLVPRPDEWSYMELNPFEEADMQPAGDGTFEMVLHRNPKFFARRSLWHNFLDIGSWRTGDLFIPHPSKPGLWRFHSRVDDLLVLSSSHKLSPVYMETILQGDPLLTGALIAGQGKPKPLLIVEPKPGAYDGNPGAFIDRIWPSIKESNAVAPPYARLTRSKVLIASPDRPCLRAPKVTVVRKLTIQAYVDDIDAAYAEAPSQIEFEDDLLHGIDSFLLGGVKRYIRKFLEDYLPEVPLLDSDNIFLRGLESLGAARLSRKLRISLVSRIPSTSAHAISISLLYRYPTVEGLAPAIFRASLDHDGLEVMHDVKSLERVISKFTENLPSNAAGETVPKPSSGISAVLIGPRGSLGPHIVRNLLLNSRIERLYCLDRGGDGRE